MRQYLSAFSKKRYSIGFNALKERPALAAAIAGCISVWSYVDNELSGLFGILLTTDSDAAHRVFTALRRWSNQCEALDAAATRLNGDELETYRALIHDEHKGA